MTITAQALWQWDVSDPADPIVVGFSNNSPTKTGVTVADLIKFVRVPLVSPGNPPVPIDETEMMQWIREAEDYVEQTAGILLTPTWVASPPSLVNTSAFVNNFQPTSLDGRMRLGIDYDIEDAGYDFMIDKFEDAGWGIQQLRYRPLRNVSLTDNTAIKSVAFTYPLLTQYFPVPPSWYVEDRDQALVRLVPAQNIQMLPLYSLQLSIGGFADDLPGGIAIQYTAGLTKSDYAGRFSFMKRLVTAKAAMTALSSIQGTLNKGAESKSILVDGVQYSTTYGKNGPYGSLITTYGTMVDDLMGKARDLVGGVAVVTLG